MTNAYFNAGVAELGRKNQPGGYVGIGDDGTILGRFANLRTTAADIATRILASGELAFATDTNEVFLGDGTTAGGLFLFQPVQALPRLSAGGDVAITNDYTTSPHKRTVPMRAGAVYQIEAIGSFYSAGNDADFALAIVYSGDGAGDRVWPNRVETRLADMDDTAIEHLYRLKSSGVYPTVPSLLQYREVANQTKANGAFVIDMQIQNSVDRDLDFVFIPRVSSSSWMIQITLNIKYRRIL